MTEQVDTMTYHVYKRDHQKMIDSLSRALQYQRDNPTLVRYFLSRTWFREDPENSAQKIWRFMDEATNHDAYVDSLEASTEDPKTLAFANEFMSLIVPGSSPNNHFVWEEIPELHVELDDK